MRRIFFVLTASVAMLALFTGTAFAHHCINSSKKAGAGAVLTGTFDVVTGEFTETPVREPNRAGRERGAWVSFTVTADGEFLRTFDIFIRRTLPERAWYAGPEADACDGKGIDEIDACFAEMFGG
ncbi:MAG: hypothetical protein H0V19_10705 [Euzebyales bacterium]|nr:hypothetical protein [Euzebyales bacterium]